VPSSSLSQINKILKKRKMFDVSKGKGFKKQEKGVFSPLKNA